MSFVILLHGGAGPFAKGPDAPDGSNNSGEEELKALRRVVSESYEFAFTNLINHKVAAADVAQYVIMLLENEPLFGARGMLGEELELAASMADGRTGRSGGAACVKATRHPVALARKVMEYSPHCLLVGPSADAFAAAHGLDTANDIESGPALKRQRVGTAGDTSDSDCSTAGQEAPERQHRGGGGRKTAVVGVVVQYKGSTAAACSAGGAAARTPGRVSYASVVGCGAFADDKTCAVSCAGVGTGDQMMRHSAAGSVANRMRFGGESLWDAARHTVYGDLPEGSGGLVGVDRTGRCAIEYNTRGMLRGQCRYTAPRFTASTARPVSEWDAPFDGCADGYASGATSGASPTDSSSSIEPHRDPSDDALGAKVAPGADNCFVAIWEHEEHFSL